jgi:hypothetical protein
MSLESDGGMILTGENRRTRRKTCPSATLSITNPTWIDPGANPDLRSERPATNDLSHGTAPTGVFNKQSPLSEPHAGVRHTYDGVLRDVPKVYLTTLLSPPQCHAAFGTMPHTLASVDQSPVRRPSTLPLSATRTPRVGFWRDTLCMSH